MCFICAHMNDAVESSTYLKICLNLRWICLRRRKEWEYEYESFCRWRWMKGRNEQWIQLTFHVCTFTSIHSYTINKTSSVYASALSLLWMTYTGMRYVMYISVNVGSPAVCLMLSIANTTYLPIVWLYKWKKLFC